jgi:hypothetical protein
MRGTVTFFAAVAIALAAPLAVAQSGATAPAAAGSASTAPAAASTGYVQVGPVTVKRGDKLIQLSTGEKLFPGDVVSADPSKLGVTPTIVIDGKSFVMKTSTEGGNFFVSTASVTKVTVPQAGGAVRATTTETKSLKGQGGKQLSEKTSTETLTGVALAVTTLGVIAAASGNGKSSSP